MDTRSGRMEKGEEDTQGQCLLPDDTSGLLVELVMLWRPRLQSPLSLLDGRDMDSRDGMDGWTIHVGTDQDGILIL
jgi:hypothetical protein